MKHPNGYVIKIKEENDNVYETNQLTETETKDEAIVKAIEALGNKYRAIYNL